MNNTPIHIVDGVDLSALVPHLWRALGQSALADPKQALRPPPTVTWIRHRHRGAWRDRDSEHVAGMSWWQSHRVRMSIGAKATLAAAMEILLHELTHNMRPRGDKHSLGFRNLLVETANRLWGLAVKDYPTRNRYSVDDVLIRQLSIALGCEWKTTDRTPMLKSIEASERPKATASVTADGRLQYPLLPAAADIKPLKLTAAELSKMNIGTRVRAFYGQRSLTYMKVLGGWQADAGQVFLAEAMATGLLMHMADGVYVDA